MQNTFARESVLKNVLRFSLPYLLSYFLQTLYGMADLLIIGQFDGVAGTTAVSIGSQVMHMVTVMLVGLAMGITVGIGHAVGAGENRRAGSTIGNGAVLFLVLSAALAALLAGLVGPITAIMLEDSAHIQEQEAEWKNRKAMRSGAEMIEPDYTVEDAQNVMKQFVPCPYEAWQTLFDGPQGRIEVRFTDVGHLLGSASISLRIAEPGRAPEIIVFSGDIGNQHQPLIKDPANPGHADYLVMESTYGDRSHGPKPDYLGELTAVLQSTFDKGGNVVIPSFAVGRTQELLYFFRQIKAEKRVKGHDNFPVFVDSPLASKSTTIFRENFAECYDDEALALVQSGQNPLQFPGLHISETKEESMAINGDPTPKVIISAAGMCDAGRIRHHLKYNLWRPECTVLFVGYQSPGTLGNALVNGAQEVKLFGEPVQVKARIAQLGGLSGHADCDGLAAWLHAFDEKPKFVFVNHGEDAVAEHWAEKLRTEGYEADAPYNGSVWIAAEGRVACAETGNTQKIIRTKSAEMVRTSAAYDRLVNMGKRLMEVIRHNQGGANKDLAKFASQIAALCDKWDR